MARDEDMGEFIDTSYGEILGEYFSVVNELSRCTCDSHTSEQSDQAEIPDLKEQKKLLETVLKQVEPDYDGDDFLIPLKQALR